MTSVSHDAATATVLEYALKYAQLGWRLVPVFATQDGICLCRQKSNCPSPGKHPMARIDPVGRATIEPAKLTMRFPAGKLRNIALATGRASGVVAFDIDGPEGQDALYRLEQRLGRLPRGVRAISGRPDGGRHFFFQAPEVYLPSKNAIASGIDWRGDPLGNSGIILLAPSVHKSGRRYKWEVSPFDLELGPLPENWLEHLQSVLKHGEHGDSLKSRPTPTRIPVGSGVSGGSGGSFPGAILPPEDWGRAMEEVRRHRLTEVSSRYRVQLALMRSLWAIPGIVALKNSEGWNYDQIEELFSAWYDLSRDFTKTPYGPAWQEFKTVWPTVRSPIGVNELDPFWERSAGIEPPIRHRCPTTRRVASFVALVGQVREGRPFTLSGDFLAGKLGLDARSCRNTLRELTDRGVLELVESGAELRAENLRRRTAISKSEITISHTPAKQYANVYRYIGPPVEFTTK